MAGRPRIVKSPADMLKRWEEFKRQCDTHTIPTGETVTVATTTDGDTQEMTIKKGGEKLAPVTYTWGGFAIFLRMSVQALDRTYRHDPEFSPVIEQIETEIEQDVRRKFENGVINSRLAPLWMSKHGYSTQAQVSTNGEAANIMASLLELRKNAAAERSEEDEET